MARVIGCITTLRPRCRYWLSSSAPTIRSRTTLVPVDVRVVDAQRQPGHRPQESRISPSEEDGVPQEIRLFDARALTPDAASGRAAAAAAGASSADDQSQPPAAPEARLFLFVFGRGRLQAPDKGIDSTIRFVRERLLPQDRVAVLAYNRATDFTTDRARIVATLERFKKAHDLIEAHLRQQFSGLQAIYGGHTPWKPIQDEIDAVFADPAGAPARRLPPEVPTDAALMAADRRTTADALQRLSTTAGRPPSPFDIFDRSATAATEMTLDEYARSSVQTAQDVENVYTGISYLKFLDGEKHLVFVTEGGLFLPRLENDHSIAALASDARVVIDVLQTGGLITMDPLVRDSMGFVRGVDSKNLARVSRDQLDAGQSMRNLAQLTGGMAAVYTPSEKTLASLDALTRSGYLLAYAPSNAAWDGRFRRIEVRVNRTDVRVLYRSRLLRDARNRCRSIAARFMTYSRIAAAGTRRGAAARSEGVGHGRVRAGGGRSSWSMSPSPRIASSSSTRTASTARRSQLAYFAGDAKQALVGEHWQVRRSRPHRRQLRNLQDARRQLYAAASRSRGNPMFVKVDRLRLRGRRARD